jgi:photosystem II stability/assembly factor-like uncharacterized protein
MKLLNTNFVKSYWQKLQKLTPQLILLLIFTYTQNIFAQWTVQSPIPTNLSITGISAPTANRIFISTDDNSFDNLGALYESTDGGNNWIARDIPVGLFSPLYGMFFLDSQFGWVYGNENYRTTDGGTTWTQLPLLGSTYQMKFYNQNFGVTSGNFGTYISFDGGLNWTPSPNDLYAFSFSDIQTALGVSSTGIYKTTDGGNSFSIVRPGYAEAVIHLTSSVVVGIVDSNYVRSTDGGETWSDIISSQGKYSLVKVSSDILLSFGRTGNFPDFDERVFRSTDAGLTWTDLGEIMQSGLNFDEFAFTVVDDQNIVATDGSGNMFNSINAGLTWQQTFTAPSGILPYYLGSAVPVFADTQTGYFGFGPGYIIKTTDAGNTWFQISSGSGNSIADMDIFSNGNIIAVGESGNILTKLNSSNNWIVKSANTQSNFKAVQVIGANDVVSVDDAGKIYFSNDGGNSWSSASSTPQDLLQAEDLYFTSLTDGWVVGQGYATSAMFHTTNAGNSWSPVGDLTGYYYSIDKQGSNIWISGIDGAYKRSTDNGSSWIEGTLPGNPYQIQDMDFYNENVGYAVGFAGQVYRSSNGGSSWQILPTPNEIDQLTDIYIAGQNELWISTNSNSVYYTANSGQGWAILNTGSQGFGFLTSVVASLSGDAWTGGYQGYIQHFAGPPPPPLNQLPTAAFDNSVNGLTVSFTDLSSDLDGSIVSWQWNFGDGLLSSEQNPIHTYDTSNTYIVWLKVTDDDGDVDSTLKIIAVQPNPGGIFGDFTEVTPLDSVFVTPQDEDFWVVTTAPADYDNDGDLDITVLGYYVVYNQSYEFRLLLLVNNGSSSPTQWSFNYINVNLGDLSTGRSDMSWGDADGDGDLDLVVGSNGETVIYRNDLGTLNLTDTALPGYWEDNSQAEFDLRSITWVDFDNDADLDLLIPSVFDFDSLAFKTSLMRNDGLNGSNGFLFTEVSSVFAPTKHASSSWADFDNDADLDLLLVNMVPNTEEGFIKRYRNEGNGTFTEQNILDSLTVEHGDIQWGDYDNDGDLDILVAGNLNDGNGNYSLSLRIYTNENDTFSPLEVIPDVFSEGWFDLTASTWADYDSDGDMDILLAGNYNSGSNIEGRARIYTNDNGNFTPDTSNTLPAPRAAGDRGGTFSWFDLDNDGDLDYFIAGQYFVPGGNGLVEAQMHVYRNDAPGQNDAPSNPSGLNAVTSNDGSVILSWIPPSDDHTPSPALTYDIKIIRKGTHTPTRPGNEFATLSVRLPEPGNISSVTEWAILGLEDGLYDWSIRAVDAAYVGSIVSSGTFQIGSPTSIDDDKNLPINFALEQNYPNPFNPSTKIKFAIPNVIANEMKQSILTTLKVYDILGNEVITLVNEEKSAGVYEIDFNASTLSSGVYFYKIQAGSFSDTKKMILLK